MVKMTVAAFTKLTNRKGKLIDFEMTVNGRDDWYLRGKNLILEKLDGDTLFGPADVVEVNGHATIELSAKEWFEVLFKPKAKVKK